MQRGAPRALTADAGATSFVPIFPAVGTTIAAIPAERSQRMSRHGHARGPALGPVALCGALALLACSAGADPSKGNAAAARAKYVANCAPCHKADGTGGVKLTGNATPNWRDPKTWANPKHNDDWLRACIREGRPKSGMIAWAKRLSDADIENLIAYIDSLAKKTK